MTTRTADALKAAEPLVQSLLNRMMPHLDDNDRDDIEQDVRVHLLEHVLPQHDPTRSKWTTFAFAAIRHRIVDAKRRLARQRHAVDIDVDKIVPDDADGGANDSTPEWLKLDVSALGQHLTRRQREVYHALASGKRKKDIAEQVGIRPDSLSQLLGRIRQRLTTKLLKPVEA